MKRFIEDALVETNTSKSEYWTDKLKTDCSKVYLEIWREINHTHEDYFWNYWTTDIQQGATEYNIQRKERTLSQFLCKQKKTTLLTIRKWSCDRVNIHFSSGLSGSTHHIRSAREPGWVFRNSQQFATNPCNLRGYILHCKYISFSVLL